MPGRVGIGVEGVQLSMFRHFSHQLLQPRLLLLMLFLPVIDSLLLLLLLLLQIPFHVCDLMFNEVQFLMQLLVLVAVDVVSLSWTVQLQVPSRLLLLL